MTSPKSRVEPSASPDPAASGPPLLGLDSTIFSTVKVELKARLGQAVLTVEDLLALRAGSIVTLDTQLNDKIDLHLNDMLIGHGEIVAVDDNFGVRVVEIAPTR